MHSFNLCCKSSHPSGVWTFINFWKWASSLFYIDHLPHVNNSCCEGEPCLKFTLMVFMEEGERGCVCTVRDLFQILQLKSLKVVGWTLFMVLLFHRPLILQICYSKAILVFILNQNIPNNYFLYHICNSVEHPKRKR